MTIYTDLEQFVHAHRPCGTLTWWANQPMPQGYRVRIVCPCGAECDRWVTAEEAEADLLRSGLLAFPN